MKAGFIDGSRGPIFHVLHEPAKGAIRGGVICVHPFAEELNKSRRMLALQARELADRGFVVLLPDHFGCGDSSGDFGDADWQTWVEDLALCRNWLTAQHPGPVVMWGLRTGCLLISALLSREADRAARVVLWQPVSNGEVFLTQFLRLRMAAAMIGGQAEPTKALRARLDAGETLEIAGYDLAPGLAAGLAGARLNMPVNAVVDWIELSSAEAAELPPASRRVIDDWVARGVSVRSVVVPGEPFWATQEIREAPALLAETSRLLAEIT